MIFFFHFSISQIKFKNVQEWLQNYIKESEVKITLLHVHVPREPVSLYKRVHELQAIFQRSALNGPQMLTSTCQRSEAFSKGTSLNQEAQIFYRFAQYQQQIMLCCMYCVILSI